MTWIFFIDFVALTMNILSRLRSTDSPDRGSNEHHDTVPRLDGGRDAWLVVFGGFLSFAAAFGN